jgi:transcriptional regulator with XRE-family HTH domain
MTLDAGRNLRALREQLGFTVRQVEAFSAGLAAKYGNSAYSVPLSRLSEIETKGVVPSIYRLYSLAVIYRRDLRQLLGWYGVDLGEIWADTSLVQVPRTHIDESLDFMLKVDMPELDATFDPRVTTNLGTMIREWGLAPLASLRQFANPNYTYGYIGTEDYTMYPILPPGSFVQIDESRNQVEDEVWHSENERPIYFVETRSGFQCCWCAQKDAQITLQPHPLSREPVRIFRYPQEAEVLGQVVGVAMRLRPRRNSP